uniref:C2orf77 protein n=1 Tax=Fopius arisanus TaxID=64838 RepID=A0A0C9RZ51_9HYME
MKMAENAKASQELLTRCPKRCQGPSTTRQPLVVSRKLYSRFVDYTTENARLAEIADKEVQRLSDLKDASYEVTKDWNDAIKNLQRRRREELLSKKEKAEQARIKFAKDMAVKNAVERAEIVKEARKLLFYKKPQCRLINSALFTSETYRELHAQLAFRKKLRGIELERDNMYAELLKKDTEDFFRKEKEKAEQRLQRTRNYAIELKKQIEDTKNHLKKLELYDAKADQEDLDNMQKESKMIEECEKEQIRKKKEYLKKMFLEQLEEKKRVEEKMREEEDIQNRSIEAYRNTREHLNQITKQKWKEEQENKIKRSEMLAKKCATAFETDDTEEEERFRRAAADKNKLEEEKAQAKRQFQEKMRVDMKRYEAEAAALKLKRELEEKNLIEWETHQRYKRDEYNKEMQVKAAKEGERRKKEMAEFLKKQMEEQRAIRKMESIMDDDSQEIQKAIQRTNDRVLAYGEEVLEESKDIRPLFPIIKAIENFKRENRLIPLKTAETMEPVKRKRRVRKICSNPTPPEQIFYLG